MALRLATNETTRIELGDGDYVELVKDISKREFNELVSRMPQSMDRETGLTPVDVTLFHQTLFDIFVKGWSLDVPATLDNYLSLDKASSDALDMALTKHFGDLSGEPDAPKEDEPKTSRRSPSKGRESTTG